MSKVGLWTDYRKTIIVSVTEKWEEIKKVIPPFERHSQHSINATIKGYYCPLQVSANHFSQKTFQEQVNIYYDEVIANIGHASHIFIFGSNTAKDKLKDRLEIHKLDDRIVSIETVAQMTDRQISLRILQRCEL